MENEGVRRKMRGVRWEMRELKGKCGKLELYRVGLEGK